MAAIEETRLPLLIAIAITLLYGIHAPSAGSLEGSYVVRTLNGRSLPADLRVPVTMGDFRLYRLEQGVLTIAPGGRFTLHFRYYHQLVRRGQRPTATPVMSDSEVGTYRITRDTILFTSRRKKGSRSRAPISATVTGEVIKTNYLIKDGGSGQRVMLVLRRDASYW
jgi:hypothetical protein